MTITIHRPIWQQRFVVVLGSAAILGGVAFAALQNTETEPVETRTAIAPVATVASESADYWKNLQLMQDNYLPPTVASESADYWKNLQLVQDSYLPPTVASGSAEIEPNGLSDNRTSGPR
ncbi:MAG: hypothetical protein WED83_02960 [Acidimicrobiia bacterium]